MVVANSTTAAGNIGYSVNAVNAEIAANYIQSAAADGIAWLKAIITIGANTGNITAQVRSVTSGTTTIYIGSRMTVTLLA